MAKARAGLEKYPTDQSLLGWAATAARAAGDPLYGEICDYGAMVGVYDIATPDVSNINWPGERNSVPNVVLARLPANGEIAFVNAFGQAHVLVDVVGYFSAT